MQNSSPGGFLPTFIGSFVGFKNYPTYSKRSGTSFLGHFLLLIVLCCSFYAFFTTTWLKNHVSPHLHEVAQNVPTITVMDGKANIDVEQPFFLELEGDQLGVLDTTTTDAAQYLEGKREFLVVVQDKLVVKESNGTVRTVEFRDLPEDFVLDAELAESWVNTLESWFLPGLFLLCFLWQACWKAVQLVFTAGVVTLIQQSRPSFGTHLKLATLALSPAMAFGVAVYAGDLFAFSFPNAGLAFWLLLGGLTLWGSQQLKNSPEHS